MGVQTKTGKQLRWYFNGNVVGMGRMTMLKPDTSIGLEAVKEAGNPDIVEYVQKVPETTVQLGYNVINKGQLAVAMGQTLGQLNNAKGQVPDLPQGFDVVEKRIKAGTEGTTAEVVEGYTLYQQCSVEKHSYDQEVDKIVSRSISVKCRTPLDFEGISGVQFDKFTANGVQVAFITTFPSTGLANGNITIRAETPLGTVLKEGTDYTVASTSSNATVTFNNAPASSTVPNVLVVYPKV